jgi:magnesium transporter
MDKRNADVREHVTRAVPTAAASDTAHEVLDGLRGNRFDSVHSVYVLGEERTLVGVVPLTDLIAAAPDTLLGALMQRDSCAVRADVDREDAASIAIREELATLPVVDEHGVFLGAFPPRAIMHVLRAEHLEDLHHMAGIWHHTEEARRALLAPTLQRARYRLPWLVIGLAGSMLAAGVVAQFEAILQAQIAVAFFIPAIVYLADAVGTQSEAVAVRGISLTDAGIGRLLAGEIAVGVLMGSALAALAGVFTVVVFGDPALALAVAVSLLAACTIATGLGLSLPWIFAKVGWDPALASGPVGTIIQDVLSLLIYFGVVTGILGDPTQ